MDVDGDSVWVGHYVPPERTPTAPTILLVPGWPASGDDVLGLGRGLSQLGSHVFVFHPRGHGRSGGAAGFENGLGDVEALWAWIGSEASPVAGAPRVLAGYSWGGGIALAYAGRDPSVERIISVAGSDHGVFIRRFDQDPEYGAFFRRALLSTQAPDGPVTFNLESNLDELRTDWASHDLVSIAPKLLDRQILVVAGWNDDQVEIELQILPFYRALQRGGARSVKIVSFQDGHDFRAVRTELLSAVHDWLVAGRMR